MALLFSKLIDIIKGINLEYYGGQRKDKGILIKWGDGGGCQSLPRVAKKT